MRTSAKVKDRRALKGYPWDRAFRLHFSWASCCNASHWDSLQKRIASAMVRMWFYVGGLAFSSFNLVPWKIRNRWRNCVHLCQSMNFRVSHIYREGNNCADKLATFGITSQCFSWWDLVSSFISEDFIHNRIGLPNYRCKWLSFISFTWVLVYIPPCFYILYSSIFINKFGCAANDWYSLRYQPSWDLFLYCDAFVCCLKKKGYPWEINFQG